MIIYLAALTRGDGPLRDCVLPALARLLGLAPWRRLPVPPGRHRPVCVSLARYRYKRLGPAFRGSEIAFPIVGSRRQVLRPAPTFSRVRALTRPRRGSDFTGSGARKFLTTPSGCSWPKASPLAQRDHLPNSHNIRLVESDQILSVPYIRGAVQRTKYGRTASPAIHVFNLLARSRESRHAPAH
ncbi:MAG: hypothetical protein K0R39_1280 [Symbiobacteriaceae bacterium]|jgi:hypothetical protein|nr:hypothetical protein [Symbiobacteriaceae bacterium]